MAITTAAAAPSLRRDGDDTTDHELVARVRAGTTGAFEDLYRRYHRRIASYIQGMVHDHARAEDITQDVFMSALRRMRETDRPIAFKPWIYEIAKNACIDQFRRSRRAEEVSYDHEDGLGSADYGKLVTKDPGPDVAVENKQSLDHLRGAFGGLSETHHEILVMRELEGLSYREIGERLGMTRPAVESTLFRARRRLTEEYEQLVTGERCQRVQAIIDVASAGNLGARDKRRLARHVSYCQPCLRHARVSGLDSADLTHTPVRQKIAALLPLPAFLKRKIAGGDADVGDVSTLSSWSAHASALDPSVVSSWGKAAAAAATIALAGVGAGAATGPNGEASALGGPSVLESLAGSEGAGSAPRRARPGIAPCDACGGVGGDDHDVAHRLGLGAVRRQARRREVRRLGRLGQRILWRRLVVRLVLQRHVDTDGAGVGADERHGWDATTDSKRTADTTSGSKVIKKTIGKLTGGGGSGGDSGSSGGGSTTKSADVQVQLPQLLPPAPAPSADTTAGAKQDPVGEVVDTVEETVDKTVDDVGDAVDGVLGGK